MKRKLHFLLAVSIGLTASVGWLHAENETHHVFHVGTIANKTGDVKGLRDSIAKAADGDTIKLASVIYLLDEQLVIDKGIVLEGIVGSPDATMIKANRDAEWPKKTDGSIDNSKTNLISIVGGATEKSVTLKNLAVYNSMASGINAQSAMKTCLEGVIIDGSMNAGLLVHSAVEVKSLKTLGNGWGSVNVDKGTSDYTPNFKFTDGNFLAYEPYKIWTELTTTENVVTLPENSNWKTYSIKKYDTNNKTWSEDKKYWTTSDLDLEYYSTFPNKSWNKGYNFVYAKGQVIKIEQSAVHPDFTAIKDNEGNILVELPKQCHPVIIGGSKSATVTNTTIVMESGTVEMLIGGGYGVIGTSKAISGDTAKVTGTTTITMTGGTVSGSLIGGGLYYNKTNKVDINLSGTASVGIPNNWVICGGLESGCTAGTAYDEFANSTNTVAEAVLKITGGTYSLIGVGGTDGANGYVQKATAIVNNATITGGVYGNGSNGRSDIVSGTFNNCTFTKTTNNPIEIAGVNRGKSKDITMTFKDCKFPENPKDIYVYLGGTYQWQTNYGGSKVGVPEKVSFSFDGGTNVPTVGVSSGLDVADVIVTGAKASIDSVLVNVDSETGKETWLKAFTLGTGKTWTFNDGLSMASGVTLTKGEKGTLKYGKSFEASVSTVKEMQDAIEMIKSRDVYNATTASINLEKDLTFDSNVKFFGENENFEWKGIFFLNSSKMNNLSLTVNGNDHSITGKKGCDDTAGSKNYLFYLASNGADLSNTFTVNDLTVKDLDVVGFNLYNLNGIAFNNITMTGNAQGAIHLNSAKMTANKLVTSGNKKFAVKLSRQLENAPGIILNEGCKLGEYAKTEGEGNPAPQIGYYDRVANSLSGFTSTAEELKKMVGGTYGNTLVRSWGKATLHTDKNTPLVRVWTSNLATEYISNSETIQLDSISSGLDSLLIDTDFATVAGVMNTGVKYAKFNKDFTASALRNGLIINCEDAYLVTGKEGATEFVENAKNKPVKRLTLADNKLAVVSAFSAPVIEDKQSWNDAKYAEQNVTITEKGILNINVAMALDTVFMEEGAQLKVLPNTAVTAKAVQLTYKVTDQWKAFGFPFNAMGDGKTMTVKDAEGTDVKTTTNGTFGKDEKGFWTAKVKASEVGFELTSSAATPDSACLIAASRADNADSLIYVTSPTGVVVSLGTKEAPVSVGDLKSGNPTLKMCANPNLYEMQLTGYAYIFDAAKNVFTQQFNPAIAPFQSYILADETTTSTLRSLRVGETPTGNETITPAEGYYVESGHGTITIRTAEPVQVVVADMLGRIYYNARVTSDGYQINLPAGIYAVNKQKVIVK